MTTDVARPPIKINKLTGKPMNPNSLANLKPPYKPGTNGHGRVYPLKERLRHALDHPLQKPKDDAPAGEHIVYATLKGAIDCEPTFAHLKEVWDRTEGKVPGDGAVINFNEIKILVVREESRALPEVIIEQVTGEKENNP